ncbi:Replication factor-A carboxy-terminal domain protein [Arachis hypogaea]|nr:Replication factor-A carboxy-terminal domain protein [Arachis hypogaea]
MQLQNNMEDKVDSIKCITAWKESWRLRVKIVRLWFYTDPLAEDNEKLLHMILMDQNLDKIQATVKEPYISIFVDDLYVGGAFCMTSFSVVPNIGIMKMTHHRFKLLFQKGTTVIPEPSLQIRDSGFSFCSMFEILEKKSDYHYLIDFIGVITSVRHQTEVDYYGKKLKLMILEIYADGVQKHSHDNFYCQVCDKNIDNVIASYRVKIIVEDSTSSGIFVLLNAAATKLFGKSCSVALDQFQKELNDFNHPLHPAFFEVVVGKELILKIEFTELIKEEFGGMFKDTFQAPAYTPICEADFHYSEIEKYTSRIPFDASIDANNIDEMLLDSISTGFNCATPDPTNTERKVPPELGNYLIQRKMVFMIDPRPLGYQYNTSVYMVHRICDDMSLVNLFEAAASMHDKKEYFMDIGCLSEATVNMEKKMDDSLLDEEVDCASSMALPDSSSYDVAEHELQNAFKICMQHQSDPTSMH